MSDNRSEERPSAERIGGGLSPKRKAYLTFRRNENKYFKQISGSREMALEELRRRFDAMALEDTVDAHDYGGPFSVPAEVFEEAVRREMRPIDEDIDGAIPMLSIVPDEWTEEDEHILLQGRALITASLYNHRF